MQRVVPGINGTRLQFDFNGQLVLLTPDECASHPPGWSLKRSMRLLQRYSLAQHGVDLSSLLDRGGINPNQLEVIYSPFFDALFGFPQVPQLITCHDLTPLVASKTG